jgi:hypothetical protein
MLRRLAALMLIALLPSGLALALPAAPIRADAYTVTGGLLDQVAKSTANVLTNKAQGLGNYNLSFHDDSYQYTLPLCADASLVEVDGRTIDPASFITGDTLVVSVRPNAAAPAKACVSRVVRQKISRGASGGECLQDYQVKQEIEGSPDKLVPQTDYVYQLTAYARPTLDCDRKAYGSAPITTVIAPGKGLIVTLTRDQKELKRWSLATDASGKASFSYTFDAPGAYHFQLAPSVATAGDTIGWDAKVTDPHPSPSPAPTAAHSAGKISFLPIVIIIIIIVLAGGAAEYWHWVKKRRANELPEDEYNRVSKL